MLTCNLRRGQIVRSRAGRDQGRYYVVIDWCGDRVMVADGYHRTKFAPKEKNMMHLWYTRKVADLTDDVTIRDTLAKYIG